jgi:hypothetical protein
LLSTWGIIVKAPQQASPMFEFVIHTLFVCFIAAVLLWLIRNHERDTQIGRLLMFFVVATGGAAIVYRFLLLP